MRTTDSLKKLQTLEIEILKEFIQVCKENDITYYIIGGTLIGAIRHGGFIPWDDDIDIAVPREDYKKLISILRNHNSDILGLGYYKDDQDLYYYPIRVFNKKYKIKEPRTKQGYSHPWIDILPLDGSPNSKIGMRLFKYKMLWYRLLLGLHYVDNLRDKKRGILEKFVIGFGKVTHIGRWINPTKIKDRIDCELESHSIESSDVIGTCMGAYFFHEFVPKEMFGKGATVGFEGIEVNAPEQVDAYLTHMYGEYMKMPPEEKRVAHNVEFIE